MLCPIVGLCANHHLLQIEASLMRGERCINLWTQELFISSKINIMSIWQNSSKVSPRACDLTGPRFMAK